MALQTHVHKYRRCIGRITAQNKDSKLIGYYKCVLPDCSHYTKAELILGKKSICNRCFKEFTLPLSIRALKNWPHCKECTRKYVVEKEVKVIAADKVSIMDEMDLVDE